MDVFSRGGAEKASLTPSKRPICSCVCDSVDLLEMEGFETQAEEDPKRIEAAMYIDRVMMIFKTKRETERDEEMQAYILCK